MSIDGFSDWEKEAFAGFDPAAAERFYAALDWLGRHLHVEVKGLDKLPKGRALLVANHTFGWDIVFVMAAVYRQLRRPVWALGEHLWWKIPLLRKLAAQVGTVDGTHENADRLLGREQLLLVLPGGMREAVKPAELRYHLLWGHRFGFIKVALRNQAPVVPVAAIGGDELFDFLGNPYERGRRWFGVRDLPIPLPKRLLPIPHRVHLRYVIGDPLEPIAGPEAVDDPQALWKMRLLVRGALQELIDDELAARLGMKP